VPTGNRGELCEVVCEEEGEIAAAEVNQRRWRRYRCQGEATMMVRKKEEECWYMSHINKVKRNKLKKLKWSKDVLEKRGINQRTWKQLRALFSNISTIER